MSFQEETGLQLDSAAVVPDEDGQAFFAITNNVATQSSWMLTRR